MLHGVDLADGEHGAAQLRGDGLGLGLRVLHVGLQRALLLPQGLRGGAPAGHLGLRLGRRRLLRRYLRPQLLYLQYSLLLNTNIR